MPKANITFWVRWAKKWFDTLIWSCRIKKKKKRNNHGEENSHWILPQNKNKYFYYPWNIIYVMYRNVMLSYHTISRSEYWYDRFFVKVNLIDLKYSSNSTRNIFVIIPPIMISYTSQNPVTLCNDTFNYNPLNKIFKSPPVV